MVMLDVFKQDAFSFTSLTHRILERPYIPGLIGKMGLFDEDPISTTSVAIEKMGQSIRLIEPTPRGGPGETGSNDKRNVRQFIVPHYQWDGSVIADEVQNLRAFGEENEVETVLGHLDKITNRDLLRMDATLEHQRIGAIKGIVITRDGATLYNWFTEFGVTPPAAVNFALGTAATDVRLKCEEVIYGIEDALDGDAGLGDVQVDGVVGRDFWNFLITHPKVEATYQNWEAAAALRTGLVRSTPFEFGGIRFHRYKTGKKVRESKNKAGAAIGAFIGTDEARFVARGVPELFKTVFAPADYNETVNTPGQARYLRLREKDNNKGYNFEMQSNPLSICARPETLFSGTRV
ncbi:MAG: major capsid protein E [Sneathiella sp.]|nr:MAG: major capsid protein E [Sneathiella sp.]